VINTRTVKHWVDNGTIGCVLAWGGRQNSQTGVDFSSRRDVNIYAQFGPFDLSLNGSHSINHGILPIVREMSEAQIAQTAQCVNSPFLVFPAQGGQEPIDQGNTLDFLGTGLVCTAVFREDGELVYRYFEGVGKTCRVDCMNKNFGRKLHVRDLPGDDIDEVTPYRIGYITQKNAGDIQ